MHPHQRQITRRDAIASVIGGMAAGFTGLATAQATNKPLAILVPYPPGASSDQTARIVQAKMQETWGQPIIVENRGGAGGSVGAAYVARSAPDGTRILLATQPILTINAHLQKDMGFDPLKDLTPLTNAVNAVVGIAVHPDLPVKTLAELIAYCKKNPGKVSFGTAGSGSPQHVGGMLLNQRAQIDMLHIPYKGGGPMLTDLLAGHVPVGIATLSVFKPYMADGRLRVLAVGEKTRYAGTPEVPTIGETLPGFELQTWLGFFGPGGLPAPLTKSLSGSLIAALQAPEVRAKLGDSALVVHAEGPEALAKLVKAEYEQYGRTIREHKITAE